MNSFFHDLIIILACLSLLLIVWYVLARRGKGKSKRPERLTIDHDLVTTNELMIRIGVKR
jgi:hypothetical protein